MLSVARQSCRPAERVRALLHRRRSKWAQRITAHLARYRALAPPAIRQARQRVLEGATVPATAKVVRLFEPHAQVIQRHKPGTPVECGRKGWLAAVEGGSISQSRIVADPGPDRPYLGTSLARHVAQFSKPPRLVAGARGMYTGANEQLAQEVGGKRVVLPFAGRASLPRVQLECTAWFRRGFRFRAGIAGRISALRRGDGLARGLAHGEAGLGRWVGWGILTANLVQISQTLRTRQAC